jgi:hypothetical protein
VFCAKRLRNLRVEEPREKVTSTDGVVLPAIWSLSVAVRVPSPTLPLAKTERIEAFDEEATLRIGRVSPAFPTIATRDEVEVVPIASAVSHPEPINIAVSVATPPAVTEPMLRPIIVPVAVVEEVNGILIPLKLPPAA